MPDDFGAVCANVVDLEHRRVRFARLAWEAGRITALEVLDGERTGQPYLIPGLVDAHVHIESSMLTPAEFARMAVRHGTLAAVSDPHEIANVLGLDGVHFMLEDAARSPFPIVFGAPSCVPATPFETAGATLGCAELEALLDLPQVGYLSEVMNFPAVLAGDAAMLDKLAVAQRRGLPVDGHAPGLRGEQARRYAGHGITTDHECFGVEEARDKVAAGMNILIREGSAARNFDALHPLISECTDRVMLCSDDKHPDDLLEGHINALAARAVAHGHDRMDVLRCASLNPIRHYGIELGLLRVGDTMDGVLVDDLRTFRSSRAWLRGRVVAEGGETLLPRQTVRTVNRFAARSLQEEDLVIPDLGGAVRVIRALDGELITEARWERPAARDGELFPDPERDLLQLLILNRYAPVAPAMGFVGGFGLHHGALASSVAHDSHNVVAVGADRCSLRAAVNAVVAHGGGIAVADEYGVEVLPLPVAGLMSERDGMWVGASYATLDERAKALGATLRAPFMTLSFMALLVIPELKLSDRGLFDGREFRFVSLQESGA